MPRGTRAAAGAVVLLLVLDGLAAVQIARSRRPPSFDRGGSFRRALAADDDAGGRTTTAPATVTTATAAPPTTAPATTTTASPTASPAVATTAPRTGPGRPPSGVYVYAVEGSESATGIGSRSLGPDLNVVAHTGGGTGADEVVFDYEYSRQHEEREILAYRPDGVLLTYEGGSLTFGPMTETSATSLDPPMTLVPAPLEPGRRAGGTSTARASDGSAVRVEDWSSEVVRREMVAGPAGPVDAWVVAFRRTSREGTRERVRQTFTWWFDADRSLPVRWEESLEAERDRGVTLRYDFRAVATLTRLPG